MHYQRSKRIFDIFATIIFLLLFSPVIILLCFLVRIYIGSPIVFSQLRPGLHEKPFKILKFRTMSNARDAQGNLLSDAQRLTKFGKLLRSLSLDELPELLNVLKGEMSLVGPRPLLMEYIPHYTAQQRVRHHVKPGITGLAQVSGRNLLSWEKKFEIDVWYVTHASMWLDIKIIFQTFFKIIKREGISASGQATMTRFDLDAGGKE